MLGSSKCINRIDNSTYLPQSFFYTFRQRATVLHSHPQLNSYWLAEQLPSQNSNWFCQLRNSGWLVALDKIVVHEENVVCGVHVWG
jgi:hypothetical protein